MGEFSEERHRIANTSVLEAVIEQLPRTLYKFVATGKCNVERGSNPSVISAQKHVFLQHASQQPLAALI